MNIEDWNELTNAYYRLLIENADPKIPKVVYSKSIKGRGYHKINYQSHGAPHKRNSDLFWRTKQDFSEKYNIDFHQFGEAASDSKEGQEVQARSYFDSVFSVLKSNQKLVDYLADTLVTIGDSVPKDISGCNITIKNPAKDKSLFDLHSLPESLFVESGEKVPNRVGFSKYAS